MIKCLIFDCDGTLVDSELLCNLALETKLKTYGIEVSANDLMQKYRGGKLAHILNDIEREYEVVLKDDFETEYRHLVDLLFERELIPCKGVSELLKEIKLPICVASSGPRKKIIKALNITGLRNYFNENIFSSYDIKSWKPDPEIFLYAAKNMGFLPNECLVIEDSIKGVDASLTAKMKTVLFDPMHIHTNIKGVIRIDDMYKLKDIILAQNTL